MHGPCRGVSYRIALKPPPASDINIEPLMGRPAPGKCCHLTLPCPVSCAQVLPTAPRQRQQEPEARGSGVPAVECGLHRRPRLLLRLLQPSPGPSAEVCRCGGTLVPGAPVDLHPPLSPLSCRPLLDPPLPRPTPSLDPPLPPAQLCLPNVSRPAPESTFYLLGSLGHPQRSATPTPLPRP